MVSKKSSTTLSKGDEAWREPREEEGAASGMCRAGPGRAGPGRVQPFLAGPCCARQWRGDPFRALQSRAGPGSFQREAGLLREPGLLFVHTGRSGLLCRPRAAPAPGGAAACTSLPVRGAVLIGRVTAGEGDQFVRIWCSGKRGSIGYCDLLDTHLAFPLLNECLPNGLMKTSRAKQKLLLKSNKKGLPHLFSLLRLGSQYIL
ncbi:uncharacterized protein [Heliangelus exortis]|uniref:uncharacterized protein n=1 Tax=Heliangelus exortis TaxID=472823 RepID=UPI003A93B332